MILMPFILWSQDKKWKPSVQKNLHYSWRKKNHAHQFTLRNYDDMIICCWWKHQYYVQSIIQYYLSTDSVFDHGKGIFENCARALEIGLIFWRKSVAHSGTKLFSWEKKFAEPTIYVLDKNGQTSTESDFVILRLEPNVNESSAKNGPFDSFLAADCGPLFLGASKN